MIIRNEPNKTGPVDIPFETVRFLSYLIFPKCTYRFFFNHGKSKTKWMSYFCYFTLIIIIFHSFVCNIFLTYLTYTCTLYVCTLTFIIFFLFLRPIHHVNLQTNQSSSSLYNNLGPCHFDIRFSKTMISL